MRNLLVGLVAVAAIVAACSSSETTSTPVIASVTMVPVKDTVLGGDTMLIIPTAQLAAVVKDASGNVLSVIQTGQPVTWTSSNTTVAAVSRYGIVRGLTLGSATITAAVAGKSDSAATTVDSLGKTVQLKATLIGARGDTLKAKKMFWASSDTSLAIVSSNDTLGVSPGNTAAIKGVKVGSVTITATIAGVSGTGSMKVLP